MSFLYVQGPLQSDRQSVQPPAATAAAAVSTADLAALFSSRAPVLQL